MGLEFVAGSGVSHGGPQNAHVLSREYLVMVIVFRSLSYIIIGSERQHKQVREVIVNHMGDIGHFLVSRTTFVRMKWIESSLGELILKC